jgi:hypothetical protein
MRVLELREGCNLVPLDCIFGFSSSIDLPTPEELIVHSDVIQALQHPLLGTAFQIREEWTGR